jgi:hypothetical protein
MAAICAFLPLRHNRWMSETGPLRLWQRGPFCLWRDRPKKSGENCPSEFNRQRTDFVPRHGRPRPMHDSARDDPTACVWAARMERSDSRKHEPKVSGWVLRWQREHVRRAAADVLAFATMALRLEPRLFLSHIAHLSTIASTLERHGCSSLSGSLAGPKDRRKLERNVPLIHIRYVLSRHLLGKYRPTAGDSEMAPQDIGIVQNRLGNGAPPAPA